MHWAQYEKLVADAFREFDFDVSLQDEVVGARGKHTVDVTARSEIAGVKQLWIVECKAWKSPVKKSVVLALQQIVQDVGADRGFVFCETGFQAGAITVALNSNLTLTSLADFSDRKIEEKRELLLRRLEKRADALDVVIADLRRVRPSRKYIDFMLHSQLMPTFGSLDLLRHALREVRLGYGSYTVNFPGERWSQTLSTFEEFVDVASRLLDQIDSFALNAQEELFGIEPL